MAAALPRHIGRAASTGVHSTIVRSCYRASRGKAHAAPLSAQESPPKGAKRISKQERRVMIEEFVEKYRASNEGRFPSIKCVRQQFGGSHYTVREIVQELEYNHANPLPDDAKSARGQGTTEKKSTGPDTIVEIETAKPGLSILDSITKSEDASLPEQTESDSMKDQPVKETEAARPNLKLSDSIKYVDHPALADQTESDCMKNRTKEPAASFEMEDKSHHVKQVGETEVKKIDLSIGKNYLHASKSTVSDRSGQVIKENMPHSEHGSKHENKGSAETGLLGSLKSFAYEIKNFWKSL